MNKNKWGKTKDHVNTDWLGGSPSGARKSWKVKNTRDIKPPDVHDSDDEKPKESTPSSSSPGKPTPTVKETKKEEHTVSPSQQESSSPQKTEVEVDPSVAKYKAMMRAGETTDYTSNEFLGDQGQPYRKSTSSPKKQQKWGKPQSPEQFRSDEWLGSPSSSKRKSYTIKTKKIVDIKPPEIDDDDEKEKEAPTSPAPSTPQKTEVDPAVAKYKAMMRAGETTDYTSNEFLGDQGQPYRKSTGSMNKNKWGKTKDHVNTDWLGGSPSGARKSWKVKNVRDIKPPDVQDSEKVHNDRPAEAPERNVMESPIAQKERIGGGSFSNAFSKFNSPPSGSSSKRNFRISKDARASDVHAGSIRHLGDSFSNLGDSFRNLDDSGPELDDSQKKELAESVQMLRKVFNHLDDREYSYGELEKVIKKLDKVARTGGAAKPTFENTIPRLQKMVPKFFDEDQSDTELVVEKLIDMNLAL
jgi:hypothetical protein